MVDRRIRRLGRLCRQQGRRRVDEPRARACSCPHGITVNTVAPGAADTEMMRSGQTAAELAEFTKMIPLGRMAAPSELTGIVLFLASRHSGYITGATINCSGGQLMY